MLDPDNHKIVIVGGGPAGLATALHIAQRLPHLAANLLILEAATYPRVKLCGGGVTFHGEKQLARLNLHINVPAFTVNRIVFRLGPRQFTIPRQNAMRIIQRDEFDAALAQAVAERGIALHQGEKLLDIQPIAGGVALTTNRATYIAAVVVAADGANSTVRRKLRMFDTFGVARLLRVMTPLEAATSEAWQQATAVFDFSCVSQGVQGYVWDFPCYVNGRATMNRGIFDSRLAPQPAGQRPNIKQIFSRSLRDRAINLDNVPLEGHPVRWFNPEAEFARPHILLAGDAAGVDPLFAEGISYAMEYGAIIAQTIEEAVNTNDFSFSDYGQRLRQHHLGRLLKRRAMVARSLYLYQNPALWSMIWRLANIAPGNIQRLFGASLALLPPQ